MADLAKVPEKILEGAAKAPKTVWGWVKSHPVIFTLMVLVLALLVLRYAPMIRGWIARIPWAGPRLMGIAEERSTGSSG